jgi:hypothetical protein
VVVAPHATAVRTQRPNDQSGVETAALQTTTGQNSGHNPLFPRETRNFKTRQRGILRPSLARRACVKPANTNGAQLRGCTQHCFPLSGGNQGPGRPWTGARARKAWARAVERLSNYEYWEGLWRRARAALAVFRPDGRLNDRSWAEAELAAVGGALRGPSWKKLRAALAVGRLLTFLDRLHRQLTAAVANATLREELVELWRLERQPAPSAAGIVLPSLQALVCGGQSPGWSESYGRVSAALSGWCGRAARWSASTVYCGCIRPSPEGDTIAAGPEAAVLEQPGVPIGKRKGRCPYQLLGLSLPTFDFWELLHADPAKLAQDSSTTPVAA